MKISKKLGMILAAEFLVVIFWPVGSSAAPRGLTPLEMSVGLSGSYVITAADDQGNGPGVGLSLRLALTDYLSLGLDGAWSRVSTSGPTADTGSVLQMGKLQQIPIQLMVELRLPPSQLPLTPYVTAGAGISLNSFDLDATIVSGYNSVGYDVSETMKNSFVFSAGAGLDITAFSPLVINAHFLYRHSLGKATWNMVDQVSSESVGGTLTDLNLSDYIIGLGLKYKF